MSQIFFANMLLGLKHFHYFPLLPLIPNNGYVKAPPQAIPSYLDILDISTSKTSEPDIIEKSWWKRDMHQKVIG